MAATHGAQSFFHPQRKGATERWVATELTRGPWSRRHQHGGPPAALVAREMERAVGDDPPMRPARATFEFLRPIPIAPLTCSARRLGSGRKVRRVSAALYAEDDVVCRATALFIRTADIALTPHPTAPGAAMPPLPEQSDAFEFPFFASPVGYHTASELRLAKGSFGSGRAAIWFRMRYPLVPEEEPTPLQRVVLAADSGNGVSKVLDERTFLFINPDLTVYLHRVPDGEWICLDATTTPDRSGAGLAESHLYDVHGPIGHGLQSLFIDRIERG